MTNYEKSYLFEYSEKEHELIAYFGWSNIAPMIAPHGLYEMMANKAFLDEDNGPAAQSVRRCLKALAGHPHCSGCVLNGML
jgi:hypothetical protein